ncbi:MAG TPA: hypothetical protein VF771_15345, partial [Longimicrobiaceae bacterium]
MLGDRRLRPRVPGVSVVTGRSRSLTVTVPIRPMTATMMEATEGFIITSRKEAGAGTEGELGDCVGSGAPDGIILHDNPRRRGIKRRVDRLDGHAWSLSPLRQREADARAHQQRPGDAIGGARERR